MRFDKFYLYFSCAALPLPCLAYSSMTVTGTGVPGNWVTAYPKYVITGAPANTAVSWLVKINGTTTFNGQNGTTDASGNLTITGNPFISSNVGSWTETVTVGPSVGNQGLFLGQIPSI